MKKVICSFMLLLLFAYTGCEFLSEEEPEAPSTSNKPTAIFTITSWNQSSEYVYVYFEITNTGPVRIDYYQVWFTVICTDSSQYTEWTNGSDVLKDTTVSDWTIIVLAQGKQASSVSVKTYELTHYD